MWLIVTPESLSQLERLNAAHDDRKIEPVLGTGGLLIVSDDPIGDPYWADYWGWFSGLPATDSSPASA